MTYAELKEIMGEFVTITKLGDITEQAPPDLVVPAHVLTRLGVVDNDRDVVDAREKQGKDISSIPKRIEQ